MSLRRRDFLRALGAASLTGCAAPRAAPRPAPRPAHRRILVLGGTGFIGPAIVRAARARGHEVTLFNRGRTNPGLFPDVEQILGDREGDLGRLGGRRWDAVIDTWARLPRLVRQAAERLRDQVDHYVF